MTTFIPKERSARRIKGRKYDFNQLVRDGILIPCGHYYRLTDKGYLLGFSSHQFDKKVRA